MTRSRLSHCFAAILTLALLVLLAPIHAADLEEEFLRALSGTKLGKTKVSLCVLDVTTGRTLVSIDADEPMIPASNMKLITAATALSTLGKDFIFRTSSTEMTWLSAVEPMARSHRCLLWVTRLTTWNV
ncbi:MAG: hypothetical protein HC898_08875 [Phycisphaerales bacterium]|nr:hypothetical protein [Phycisphaerales bacterium]